MSIYNFLASDEPMETVENKKIELLSIEEAEARGLALPNWYSKDMDIDRNEKIVLFAPDEECLREIEIMEDNASTCARQYSNKRYFSSLHWTFSDKRATQLIHYIGEHLKTADEIELWNIWLNEYDAPGILRRRLDTLTCSDIKAVLGQSFYEKPLCLIVQK